MNVCVCVGVCVCVWACACLCVRACLCVFSFFYLFYGRARVCVRFFCLCAMRIRRWSHHRKAYTRCHAATAAKPHGTPAVANASFRWLPRWSHHLLHWWEHLMPRQLQNWWSFATINLARVYCITPAVLWSPELSCKPA